MKTILRVVAAAVIFVISAIQVNAQCSASEILIQNIVPDATQSPGTCSAKFDLSFQMQSNNGNKFIFLHAFIQSQYPNYFNCVNGHPSGNGAIQPPMGSNLTNSFLNIGINNSAATPSLIPTYTPDPTNVAITPVDSVTKSTLPNGSTFFVLHGVHTTLPAPCDSAYVIVFDFWSSQSASASVAQCVNCNVRYPFNFLSVSGVANCATLTYSITITNRTDTAVGGYIRVFADVNGDGFLGTGVDALITDTTQFTIAPGPGTTTTITGTIPAANINQELLSLVTITSGGASDAAQITVIPTTICAPLPVTFLSFTATRSTNSVVALRWQTATEINNSSFAVQRNMGAGNWETVAYLPTQAPGGNSNTVLTYDYNDGNASRNITQYRIRQTDIDGRSRYSEIRAVRGFGQKGSMIIYPNPSKNGTVTVLFDGDEEAMRQVVLLDMNGRTVKEWKNLSSNTIQIDNLGSGVYTLRVVVRGSGEQTVEKFVVNR